MVNVQALFQDRISGRIFVHLMCVQLLEWILGRCLIAWSSCRSCASEPVMKVLLAPLQRRMFATSTSRVMKLHDFLGRGSSESGVGENVVAASLTYAIANWTQKLVLCLSESLTSCPQGRNFLNAGSFGGRACSKISDHLNTSPACTSGDLLKAYGRTSADSHTLLRSSCLPRAWISYNMCRCNLLG